MDKIFEIIKTKLERNEIKFSEPFYISDDKKTIMGEVPFSEILFLEYRDTEAGSNPREYIGLKKTNESIIKSLLLYYSDMFRFLHSGMIASLVNPTINIDSNSVFYDDCCLTNGNQTRFIILIIVFLKLMFNNKKLSPLKQNQINSFVKSNFPDTPKTKNIPLLASSIALSMTTEDNAFFNENPCLFTSNALTGSPPSFAAGVK